MNSDEEFDIEPEAEVLPESSSNDDLSRLHGFRTLVQTSYIHDYDEKLKEPLSDTQMTQLEGCSDLRMCANLSNILGAFPPTPDLPMDGKVPSAPHFKSFSSELSDKKSAPQYTTLSPEVSFTGVLQYTTSPTKGPIPPPPTEPPQPPRPSPPPTEPPQPTRPSPPPTEPPRPPTEPPQPPTEPPKPPTEPPQPPRPSPRITTPPPSLLPSLQPPWSPVTYPPTPPITHRTRIVPQWLPSHRPPLLPHRQRRPDRNSQFLGQISNNNPIQIYMNTVSNTNSNNGGFPPYKGKGWPMRPYTNFIRRVLPKSEIMRRFRLAKRKYNQMMQKLNGSKELSQSTENVTFIFDSREEGEDKDEVEDTEEDEDTEDENDEKDQKDQKDKDEEDEEEDSEDVENSKHDERNESEENSRENS